MRSLKTYLVAALAFASLSATAQTKKVVDRVDQRTVQELDHQESIDHFKSHAFLTLQGGAQYTLGEAKFDKLISPNVQLGIGYQFNPWFAARLQANGWQSKGGWNGFCATANSAPYTNDYKWNYVAPGIDLMFDLTNAFGGWNPKRLLSVVLFVGGGANIGWKNDEANAIGANVKQLDNYLLEYLWDGTKVRPFGRGGLQLGFRLSDAVSLLLEGNANILGDKYNSKKADNPDWYFNALAGLRINLGKTYTVIEKPAPAPEPEPTYVAPAPEPAPVVVEQKVEPIRRDVFFIINKFNIEESEAGKIKDVAEYMKNNPKAKVQVTGYADAGTGNDQINDRLAQQRADVVVKALIEQYEIAADRISYDSKGARVQPFAENDKNRVTIMIAE